MTPPRDLAAEAGRGCLLDAAVAVAVLAAAVAFAVAMGLER